MISIEKVTVNMGVGASGERLEQAKKLLENITGQKPLETVTQKRIPKWGVRKNMKIGVKVTLRGKKASDFLNKALDAVGRKISKRSFDKEGNFAFGIKEYIDLPGVKYNPDIGMFGFDVCVTLKEWGYRLKERKRERKKVPRKHRISKEEAISFVKEKLGVEVV